VLATAACQATTPAGGPGAPGKPRPRASAAVDVSPAAPSGVAALLRPPAGNSLTVTGAVVIDASYLTRTETGTALSLEGSALVAAGRDLALADAAGVVSKTRMLDQSGASVVSKTRLLNPDGTPVVSKTRLIGLDGAPVVSKTRLLDARGELVAVEGGNVISHNGASLISDAGGSAVSNAGGSLVGKSKYMLAAAEAVQVLDATTGPSFGTQLPAAGMQIAAISLRTGSALPIGEDPEGKPVFSIITNLAGGYTLHLPPEEAGNVLVVAGVPEVQDPRSRYALLAPAKAGVRADLDEDTSAVTRTIREVLAHRLAEVFVSPPARATCLLMNSGSLPADTGAMIAKLVEDLHEAAASARVTADPAQRGAVSALSRRVADLMLAPVDLPGIVIAPNGTRADASADVIGSPALTVLVDVMRDARERATAKLAADPGFLSRQDFFRTATACDPTRYRFEKPSDLNAFVLEEYLLNNSDPGLLRAADVFLALGMPTTEFKFPYASAHTVRAIDAIVTRLMLNWALDEGQIQAQVKGLIAGYDPAAAGEAPAAFLRSPCPRPAVSASVAPCP